MENLSLEQRTAQGNWENYVFAGGFLAGGIGVYNLYQSLQEDGSGTQLGVGFGLGILGYIICSAVGRYETRQISKYQEK